SASWRVSPRGGLPAAARPPPGGARRRRRSRSWSGPRPSQRNDVLEVSMNKFEEIKAARDGLDVLPDIERYAAECWEAIADDDKVRMKWYGLFFRRHIAGHFMLRVRVPNGI